MKRLILIAVTIALLIGILATGTIAFAQTNTDNNQISSVSGIDQPGIDRLQILAKRLLLVQDEAKVNTLLANLVKNGRLNQTQADRIKTFWQNNHRKLARFARPR